MIKTLNDLDAALLLWINSFHSPFFDQFMNLVSGKWVWVPMYVGIFIVLAMRLGFKPKLVAILATIGVALFFSDFVCAEVIRPIFNRPRPTQLGSGISHLVHIVDNYRGGDYGFPSCHASNSFMLATTAALLFRNKILSAFFFLWALAMCYSRAYLGVHYPGDLLAGAVWGIIVAFALYALVNRYYALTEVKTAKHTQLISIVGASTFVLLAIVSAVQTCVA